MPKILINAWLPSPLNQQATDLNPIPIEKFGVMKIKKAEPFLTLPLFLQTKIDSLFLLRFCFLKTYFILAQTAYTVTLGSPSPAVPDTYQPLPSAKGLLEIIFRL